MTLIGKAQDAIVDYYIAKEKYLKDITDVDIEFINTELLSEIYEWSDVQCVRIINEILNGLVSGFDGSTCPHCTKYLTLDGEQCYECTYGKMYGICDKKTNPWYIYSFKYGVSYIPIVVVEILKKGL